MRVHTTCNVFIMNTSRVWTCHTQHLIDITINVPSEQKCFCITTQCSKCNQSKLYSKLLEHYNLYHLTGIHNYKKSKKSKHHFTFLDNTASFVLNSSCEEIHHPSPWLSNTLFERLFLPEKVTNYKTSTVISHKHEFLMVVITTEHVALSNSIQYFLYLIILCMFNYIPNMNRVSVI